MKSTGKMLLRLSGFISLVMVVNGCLEDNSEELVTAHDVAFEKFKVEYNITEADHIGDGIYLHFTQEHDTLTQEGEQMVVVDLFGKDSQGNIYDITDYDKAVSSGIDREDHIYGPKRVDIMNTFIGFYKAIQLMPEKSSAVMLFPHEQAFWNYEPLVYEVKVHRIINDLDAYNYEQFKIYMDSLGITNEDTLVGREGAYFKEVEEGIVDSTQTIELGDIVSVRLKGYYIETDTAYVESFPGRRFFPFEEDEENLIEFKAGELNYPITDIVAFAAGKMDIGDVWKVLSHEAYCYGEEGFRHPYTGAYIVPTSMPLYYEIELVDFTKATSNEE